MLIAIREGYTLMPCQPLNFENPPMAKFFGFLYLEDFRFHGHILYSDGVQVEATVIPPVYHHTTIFLFYWLNLQVNYDGDIYLTIVLNGLIHAMMYTYYFVSLHTHNIW